MFCFRSHMHDSHSRADADNFATALHGAAATLSLKKTVEALIARAPPVPPGHTYDVGPDCPRDDLYYRLEACRALQRMHPPALGSIRRYS